MVRWRGCFVILMFMLLIPLTIQQPDGDDYDGEEVEQDDSTEQEEGNDDDEEQKPSSLPKQAITPKAVSRTTIKGPIYIECYMCAFKKDMPMGACLDPTYNRVQVATCENENDKCFTRVLKKAKNDFEAIFRGCKSQCVTSEDNTCCETSRCNNETFSRAVIQPKSLIKPQKRNTSMSLTPNIVMFVTAMLILQTISNNGFSPNK